MSALTTSSRPLTHTMSGAGPAAGFGSVVAPTDSSTDRVERMSRW